MIKIQINLYEHREIDKKIIEALGFNNTSNPNALAKDLLFKMSTNTKLPEPIKEEIKLIEEVKEEIAVTIEQPVMTTIKEIVTEPKKKNKMLNQKLLDSAQKLF